MTPETPISGLDVPAETKPKAKPAEEPKLEEVAATNGHADRSSFLALVGDLAEATVPLKDSKGKQVNVLVRELTGAERADLITLQAEAYQQGSLKIREYEQKLLLAGIADPETPKGARQPLLKRGDDTELMKLGASKVQELVQKIEELSNLGAGALARAEGNSETTPSEDSTSG